MSHILGGFKLFDSLKITFSIGFTAQDFVTFFIEHPVFYKLKRNFCIAHL